MSEIYILPFLVQGTTVILSYIIFWPNENLWAILNDRIVFYIWLVSALISTSGFIYYSIEMILYKDKNDPLYELMSLPYCFFLLTASCYMPFAVHHYVLLTMICLFLSGVCTIVLFAGSIVMFNFGPVTVLMGFLCFHCVVIDFIFWGFSWIYRVDSIYG
jgi:hypothetical protein